MMVLAFHTAAMGRGSGHVGLCLDVVDLHGFRLAALFQGDIFCALRRQEMLLRFGGSTGLGVFQCFDGLNLPLISLGSLDNCPTRAILRAFADLQRPGSLDKGLRPRG